LLIEVVNELVVAIYVIGLAIVIAIVDLDDELIYEYEDVPELQVVRAGKGTPATPKVHVAY
jgi:hypothetical protein